jgi:membrane protein
MVAGVRNPFAPVDAAVRRLLNRRRDRWPWFDHVARAGSRYQRLSGNRLAAGLTYYSFLSFFPLLVVAFAVVGYLITVDPGLQDQVERTLQDNFPGLVGSGPNQLHVSTFSSAKVWTAAVGLIGLIWTGLGWLDAVRDALRTLWGMQKYDRNVALRKLDDLGLLVAIGVSLLLSVAIAGVGNAYTSDLLHWIGWSGSTTGRLTTKVVSVVLGFLVDLPLFVLMFTAFSGWRPRKRVLRGVLLASVGFEVLKLVGAILLARTTSKPAYATFAVGIGLLVWMYLVNRVLLFSAAWTVTGPGDDGPSEPVARPWRRRRSSSEAQAALEVPDPSPPSPVERGQ